MESGNDAGSEDALMKKNYFQELAECGAIQRWKFEMRRDGMHPNRESYSCDAFLKLWPCGGVTGFIPGIHVHKQPIQCHVDIFGSWKKTGVCLNFLSRDIGNAEVFVGLNKCEGRWTEGCVGSLIEEGRISHLADPMTNARLTQTIGTFKMSLITGEQEVKVENDQGKFVQNLRSHIQNAPKSQHFYDFEIECHDGTVVKCHRIVLVSQTKYFEGLFRQEQTQSHKVKIQFAGDVVKRCIQYLYTGQIDIDGDNVQDTLIAANYLLLNDVVSICVSFILSNMDLTNCIDILNFGENFGVLQIVQKATKMLSCNFQTLFINDESNLKNVPLHLFKSVITNDLIEMKNEYKISMRDEELKLALNPVIKQYCELNGMDENVVEEIDKAVTEKDYTLKKFCLPQIIFPSNLGQPADAYRKISSFDVRGNGEKYIRKIDVNTNTWDGRTVIAYLGLSWSDGATTSLGEREGTEHTASFEVPDGEHVSFVIGYTGWYVDNLSFILSNGTMLDAVGGDGGGFRNSIGQIVGSLNLFNMFLDGVKGDVVESQGVSLLTRLQFQYGYIGDQDDKPGNGMFNNDGNDGWLRHSWWDGNDNDDDDIHPELF